MIDVCGGCSRLGKEFSNLYNKVSVLDLNPSFGEIPSNKQGDLIKANFKDIGHHIEPDKYHFMLLNWSFCYINYDDIKRVLPYLHGSLKSIGYMVIKEPILEKNERTPRFCPSGQYLITRPKKEIMYLIQKYFFVMKEQIIRQEEGVDR